MKAWWLKMRASWVTWTLGIASALIVLGVGAAFGFSVKTSQDMARFDERHLSEREMLSNTRLRAIDNEAEIRRVATEWDQFKEWYQDDRKQNREDHKEIIATLKALEKGG